MSVSVKHEERLRQTPSRAPDFGEPKWYLLEVLKVPSVYRGLRLVYFYDDDTEFDVSQNLHIEYYD